MVVNGVKGSVQHRVAATGASGTPSSVAGSRKRRATRVTFDKPLSRPSRLALGLLGVIVVLASWQLAPQLGLVNRLASSDPVEVFHSLTRLLGNGELGRALADSGRLFSLALAISLAIGVIGGIIIGWYKRLGALLDPLVSIAYASPRIALIPVITVWFGIGFKAQLVTVILMATFPLMVNVQAGVAAVDRDLVRVARVYGGGNTSILLTVALPGAIPHVVSGIRQSVTHAIIGVVVAEYLIGSRGIGGLIVSAGQSLNLSVAYVGVLITAMAALVLTMLIRRLERRLDHWRK